MVVRGVLIWGMGGSISVSVRIQIIEFDERVAGVSVSAFCRQVKVSRASFYRIRALARRQGTVAALSVGSRAPKNPARRWGPDWDERIAQVRGELEAAGMEAGPWSVWWRLSQGGCLPAPSRATIARRLRAMGLVVPAPRKRPRGSYKRFTRSSANEMWQIDGMTWSLEEELVTIYQVVDDCSRLLVALQARRGAENAAHAQQVLAGAFTTWGRPALVLSDNGRAFNTHRTGIHGATEKWLAAQGVRPVSGRVGHPQTQGKVERAHQGVRAWLAARTPTTLNALQQALDDYTRWYNTERQHQGLGTAVTPLQVWQQAPRALPSPVPVNLDALTPSTPVTLPPLTPQPHDRAERRVQSNGSVSYKGRSISIGTALSGTTVTILEYPVRLDLYDGIGQRLATLPWPQPTQVQAGNRRLLDARHAPNRLIPPPPRRHRTSAPRHTPPA